MKHGERLVSSVRLGTVSFHNVPEDDNVSAAPATPEGGDVARIVADGCLRTGPAVEFTGWSRTALFAYKRAGRIRAIRSGRKTLWPRSELRRLMAELLAAKEGADPLR